MELLRGEKWIELFEEALHLFYDLRVLRIYFAEVEMLRRFIWRISVDVYMGGETESSSSSNTQLAFKVNIPAVEGAIRGGLSVGCHPDCLALRRLHELTIPFKRLSEYLVSGGPTDQIALEQLRKVFDEIYGAYDVRDTDYLVVRARSHIHALEHRCGQVLTSIIAVDTSAKVDYIAATDVVGGAAGDPIDVSDTRFRTSEDQEGLSSLEQAPAQPILYCWCRKEDHGQPMICCDSCEEWFHWSCVGVTKLSTSRKRKSKMDSSNQRAGSSKKAIALSPEHIDLDGSFMCIYCSDTHQQPYRFQWS